MQKDSMKYRALTLWLIFLLLIIDWALSLLHPLNCLPKIFRPISVDSWVSKFPIFFRSRQTPDIVVLGSSLPMAGFSITDSYLQGLDRERTNETLRTTLNCESFSVLFRNRLGISGSLDITNLTCAGCMISDVYHLIDRAVSNGIEPKVIFLGIAPRDFSDNWIPPVGQTPLWQTVDQWDAINLISSHSKSLSEKLLIIGKEISEFLRIRKDLKTSLGQMFLVFIRKPNDFIDAWSVSEKKETSSGDLPSRQNEENKSKILSSDLKTYTARYNPSNLKRFKLEEEYLKKVILLCRDRRIALIIVNMPIMPANLALLSPEASKAFRGLLCDLSSDDYVKFIQCNRSDIFVPSDFSDSVHLNVQGASKFQKLVVNSISVRDLGCLTQVEKSIPRPGKSKISVL